MIPFAPDLFDRIKQELFAAMLFGSAALRKIDTDDIDGGRQALAETLRLVREVQENVEQLASQIKAISANHRDSG